MSILSNTHPRAPALAKEKIQATIQNTIENSTAEVTQEFKNFVCDVERLVKETANLTGDDLARTKIQLNQRILAAQQYVSKASNTLVNQTQKAATLTNEYVHEKPWAVIGTGAVVSFVLGLLLGNRNDDPPNK